MPKSAPRLRHAPIAPAHRVQEPSANYGKGRGGRPWRRLRDAILERDGRLCQCEDCKAAGAMLLATEVDHITPRSRGGTDDPGNLRAINVRCHAIKTQREAADARRHGSRRRSENGTVNPRG
jgi:5-methylcytosine-specific restriction protein A